MIKLAKEVILVVDDDDAIRLACIAALKTEGYVVTSASSGEVALELLKKFKYDLVLTDYSMGEVSGLDLLKISKAMNPSCHVILMTAFASQNLAKEVLRGHEGTSFLCKPINVANLRETVKNCLARGVTKKHLEDTKNLMGEMKSDKNTINSNH
ncbi:MAG: response regulator [Endomicrobiales bacterium]|nr:response regulator [Endomicrobiales bacterium]